MFVHKLGFLLFVLSCARAELWTPPTARDIQTALEACQGSGSLFLSESVDKNTDIRCFATALGLWSDDEGFITKRFVKLLNKYHQPLEISIVIDFCNRSRRQADAGKWARQAFDCFASGRLGDWINKFIKDVYKNKTNE